MSPLWIGLLLLGLLLLARVAIGIPWPKRGDQSEVSQYFVSLGLFGLDRSCVSLRHCSSGRTLRFVKRDSSASDGELFLQFERGTPTPASLAHFEQNMRLQGLQVQPSVNPDKRDFLAYRLGHCSEVSPATGEAVARHAVQALGIDFHDRFIVSFLGPKDVDRINEYFGFKPRKRR